MSETLKKILEHWTDEEDFAGECGTLDLPFDIESFCAEQDKAIKSEKLKLLDKFFNEIEEKDAEEDIFINDIAKIYLQLKSEIET